jgi:hypothetical protein
MLFIKLNVLEGSVLCYNIFASIARNTFMSLVAKNSF